jgi:FkbM family methyltransferase
VKYFIWNQGGIPFHQPVSMQPSSDLVFSGFIHGSDSNIKTSFEEGRVSFINFLRITKKESVLLVLNIATHWSNLYLKKYLNDLTIKFNFHVIDMREFCIKYNMRVMYDGCLIEKEKIINSESKLREFSKNLTDDFSKLSMDAYINSYKNESLGPLLPAMVPHSFEMFNRFSNHFSFVPSDEEIYVDVGAFDGDSILKFIDSTINGKYKHIFAFEPNPMPRSLIVQKAQWLPNVTIYPYALSDDNGSTTMLNTGMGTRISKNNDVDNQTESRFKVDVRRMDDVLSNATMIKIDTEGFEVPVINGSKRIIKNSRPNLIVDTYHYPLDMLKIYDAVMTIYSYKYVSWRICHQDLHSLFFSDTQEMF